MIYHEYTVGGELYHSEKGGEWSAHKYIDKVRTKTGKWRYIYKKTGLYKNLESKGRHLKYFLSYDKNKRNSKKLDESSQEKMQSAQDLRAHVRDLDEAAKNLGVDNDNEKVRTDRINEARDLERRAMSEARESERLKKRYEDTPQHEIATQAKGMAVDTVNQLIDLFTKKEKKK